MADELKTRRGGGRVYLDPIRLERWRPANTDFFAAALAAVRRAGWTVTNEGLFGIDSPAAELQLRVLLEADLYVGLIGSLTRQVVSEPVRLLYVDYPALNRAVGRPRLLYMLSRDWYEADDRVVEETRRWMQEVRKVPVRVVATPGQLELELHRALVERPWPEPPSGPPLVWRREDLLLRAPEHVALVSIFAAMLASAALFVAEVIREAGKATGAALAAGVRAIAQAVRRVWSRRAERARRGRLRGPLVWDRGKKRWHEADRDPPES